jgi:hypothetical protein
VILANTRAGAEATRKRYVTGDGLESSVVRYFGMTASANPAEPPQIGSLYPVAFRVEQDPGTVSEPHFHQANQFQVFVEGDGFLGKTPVREVTVQYADAYTPYGPIVAGPHGVAYMRSICRVRAIGSRRSPRSRARSSRRPRSTPMS